MISIESAGAGLRAVLKQACAEEGCRLGELTVLSNKRDPYRVDTPARRRDGQWLAVHADQHVGDRQLHLRGFHYVLVTARAVKPNEIPYMNIDDDWEWLQEDAAKAARWLGYLPFERIVDARNSEPVVILHEHEQPISYVTVGAEVEIPEADELEPRVEVEGFVGVQPYKLVLVGEKTSLGDVLGPIAEDHAADLYLPAGEISDTRIYQMARIGAEDARPMVVLYFADCDPAGWQMPISVGRKLQALRDLQFPELDFRVQRVGLTPDHVREYGLPSTPLKPEEKRADDWMEKMGVEQTEIDALAALQPELLRRLALEAISPFYDYTLGDRVAQAHRDWIEEAQVRLDEQIDQEKLNRLRTEAEAKLGTLREEIDAVNEALRAETGDDFDLPVPVVPSPVLNRHVAPEPLIDSGWSWVEQTLALKASKAYRD
jgi:hypothetical protein